MNGLPSESASIIGFVTHLQIIFRDEGYSCRWVTSKMAFQSMIDNGMKKKNNVKIRH
jgi:hypothetical protein